VKIKRGKRTVYRASRRHVPAGRRTLRFRVGKRIHGHRRYRITVTATIGSKHVRKGINFRIR
jgi:hypothetical protein